MAEPSELREALARLEEAERLLRASRRLFLGYEPEFNVLAAIDDFLADTGDDTDVARKADA